MQAIDTYKMEVNNRASSVVSKLHSIGISVERYQAQAGIPAIEFGDIVIYVLHDYYELWIGKNWMEIKNEEALMLKIKALCGWQDGQPLLS